MIGRALMATAVLALALSAPAAAQGDPVLFQVIVPNERDAHTVEVTLQIPKDVLPFSFEDPPGWTRENQTASDGSLDTITWKGELAEDGFARFAFLASTPEQEGEIVWKAIQTYDDGSVSRWIGAPSSDNPAAVTRISNDAPRENAGGEGAEAEAEAPAATATAAPATENTAPAAATTDDSDSPLPFIFATVALVFAVLALLLTLRRR